MNRAVVTGAAGFIGSHLCDWLLARGDEVIGIDDLSSGTMKNLSQSLECTRFMFHQGNVCDRITIDGTVDIVAHLASPASPADYLGRPLDTLRTGSRGTESAIDLALEKGARFLLASTSEVYGDPSVHPQPEEYWGNVNPIGPRSVYDESKRYAEALTVAYVTSKGLNAGIVRIFNTYGPRLRPGDGRVIPTFVRQSLAGDSVTIFGQGSQTRSFCYVDDLVTGLGAMLDSHHLGPINLGYPEEITISALASLVIELTGSASSVTSCPLPIDDPVRRCPVIDRASTLLGWAPKIDIATGLDRVIASMR